MEENKKKNLSTITLGLIILTLIILIVIAIYLGIMYKKAKDEIDNMITEHKEQIEQLEQKHKEEIEQLEQKHKEEIEQLEQKYQGKIDKIKKYYEEKNNGSNNIKLKIDINNNSYYDDLSLHVGDIYNVMGKKNSIVVFCSVKSGDYPKVGDICHLEAKEDGYVYEAMIYKVEKSSNSDGSELLFVYFEGAEEKSLKFTPQIRRLK